MCCGKRGFSRVIEYKQLVQCLGAVGRKQASDMRNSQWISSLLAQGTHGLICHHELISIWQTLVHKRLLICSLDSEGEGGASSSVLPSGKDQMWSLEKKILLGAIDQSLLPAETWDDTSNTQHTGTWMLDRGQALWRGARNTDQFGWSSQQLLRPEALLAKLACQILA